MTVSSYYPARNMTWVDRVDGVDDCLDHDFNTPALEVDVIEEDLVGATGTSGGLKQAAASFYDNWTAEHTTAGSHLFLPPVGSIIPIYDFGGALSFDSSKWAYCDGKTVTISGIGSATLPDLSGRYIVGFGTDGGADMGSAAWSIDVQGNANNAINIAHAHTLNSHTHSISGNYAHTHGITLSSGTHAHDMSGTFVISMHVGIFCNSAGSPTGDPGIYVKSSNSTGSTVSVHNHSITFEPYGGDHGHSGSVASSGATTATGTPSVSSDSSLSSGQSIQPRSIKVRYIMRIA